MSHVDVVLTRSVSSVSDHSSRYPHKIRVRTQPWKQGRNECGREANWPECGTMARLLYRTNLG
jgi:hypothetical protein